MQVLFRPWHACLGESLRPKDKSSSLPFKYLTAFQNVYLSPVVFVKENIRLVKGVTREKLREAVSKSANGRPEFCEKF